MDYPTPLIKAKLIKRYKRFFVDAFLDSGEMITAHCPNTGSLKSCFEEGSTIYLSQSNDPKRKLKYTWELVQHPLGYIGVNTQVPNKIVEEAFKAQKIAELKDYDHVQREVKWGEDSRLDFLLSKKSNPNDLCYVEVKNVTYFDNEMVQFPDAKSSRGLKHLEALQEIKQKGMRAVIFFLVNRPDGKSFRAANEIDKLYAEGLNSVCKAGVETIIYRTDITAKSISVGASVAWTK